MDNPLNQSINSNLIKRNPYFGNSTHLINSFMILGYEQCYIRNELLEQIEEKEKLTASASNETQQESANFKEFNEAERPTLLSIISNLSDPKFRDFDLIRNIIFPNPPGILYTNNESSSHNKNPYSCIFSETTDVNGVEKNITYLYSYIFYEEKKEKKKKLLIPKAFCIISGYPFFSLFYDICIKIYTLFKKTTEIPFEILIFNIVNYTPCPLTYGLNLNLFPSLDLATYGRQKNFEHPQINDQDANITEKKQTIPQLTGFPFIDLDLSQIFNIFNVNMLIKTYLFTLLERDMIFPSKDIEILNISLYIIANLAYPFTDTGYSRTIASISKGDRDNAFYIASNTVLFGVNESEDVFEEMKVGRESFLYYSFEKGEVLGKGVDDKTLEIKDFINSCLEDASSSEPNTLKAAINKLQKRLTKYSEENKKKDQPAKFLNSFEGRKEINEGIMFAFYEFNLSLMKLFVPYYFYKKKEAGEGDDYDYHIGSNTSSKEEKLFFDELQETDRMMKFLPIIENTDKVLLIQDYIAPLQIFEEFLQQKISEGETEKDYPFTPYGHSMNNIFYSEEEPLIKIINTLSSPDNSKTVPNPKTATQETPNPNNENIPTQENTQITLKKNKKKRCRTFKQEMITFIPFYIFFSQKLVNKTDLDTLDYLNLKKNTLNAFGKRTIKYDYKTIEIDNDLIAKYIYYIKELNDIELTDIFPSAKIRQKNEIVKIKPKEISDRIEEFFMFNGLALKEDFILSSFLMLCGLVIHKCHSTNLIGIMENVLMDLNKNFVRNHLYMLISIYYNLSYDLLHNGKNNPENINNALIYNQCISKLLGIIKNNSNTFCLNKSFRYLLMSCMELDKEIKGMSSKKDKNILKEEERPQLQIPEEFKKTLDDKIRATIKEISPNLQTESLYEIILRRNFCRDGVKDDNWVKNNISYDQFEPCPDCKKIIRPSVRILKKNENECKPFDNKLITPLELYFKSKKIIEEYLIGFKEEVIDWNSVMEIAANLVYYINTIQTKNLSNNNFKVVVANFLTTSIIFGKKEEK
ncbi:MAG: hypothetical protein MJ252_11070 [archaeon]|nr:hypothetical protein [archaeon]